jgi:hypothetical protein
MSAKRYGERVGKEGQTAGDEAKCRTLSVDIIDGFADFLTWVSSGDIDESFVNAARTKEDRSVRRAKEGAEVRDRFEAKRGKEEEKKGKGVMCKRGEEKICTREVTPACPPGLEGESRRLKNHFRQSASPKKRDLWERRRNRRRSLRG